VSDEVDCASVYRFISLSDDRPEVVAEQDLVALHQALMSYVQTEFVEGDAELGLSCKSYCLYHSI
jgi:hypothetical protein